MFLRSQLASRLPAMANRLYCNSVPSTSSWTFYQSPASTPIHPHGFTPQLVRHFGASLAWFRGNRKDRQEAEEVRGTRTKHTADSNSSSSNKGGPEPIKPVEPWKKWLVVAFIAYLAVDITLDLRKIMIAKSAIPADAPQVDFATFAQKYLRAGEIQKITFVNGQEKAVGTLHAGAIIDGKPAKSDHIVISYAHPARQFTTDVRKEEAAMGITPEQGVDIQLESHIPTSMRIFSIVLSVACAILAAKKGGILPSRMNMLLEEAGRNAGKRMGVPERPPAKHTVNDKKMNSSKSVFSEIPFSIVTALAMIPPSAFSYWLFDRKRLKANSPAVTNAPQVGSDDFIEKYLRAGEIRFIMFFGNEKVVGILKPKAYIDGKPAKSDFVVIKLHQAREQFWDSVRKAEAEMGVSKGVLMGDYNAYPTWKKAMAVLWLFILLFLCQYGRRDMRILKQMFGRK